MPPSPQCHFRSPRYVWSAVRSPACDPACRGVTVLSVREVAMSYAGCIFRARPPPRGGMALVAIVVRTVQITALVIVAADMTLRSDPVEDRGVHLTYDPVNGRSSRGYNRGTDGRRWASPRRAAIRTLQCAALSSHPRLSARPM
ncbi:hypothetical protein MTO96_011733 [Rhipicephalus appendiculatus]